MADDPHASDELHALRAALAKADSADQLFAFAQAYAALANAAPSAVSSKQDTAALLSKMSNLRTPAQCQGFAGALRASSRLGRAPLSSNEAGLVYAAALLEPVCADKELSKQFVNDYQDLINQQAGAKPVDWQGDVWAFASWARTNISGFDLYQTRVGFLKN